MVTQAHGRVAAWVAAAIFVMAAGVQFYAVLDEAVGADPPPVRELIGAALMGLLALAAAAVLLVRVGYWRAHVSFEVGRTYAPWVAYVGLGGAVGGFAGQMGAAWYIAGPVNLVIALLAFVVARSELPGSPTSGARRGRAASPGRQPRPTDAGARRKRPPSATRAPADRQTHHTVRRHRGSATSSLDPNLGRPL